MELDKNYTKELEFENLKLNVEYSYFENEDNDGRSFINIEVLKINNIPEHYFKDSIIDDVLMNLPTFVKYEEKEYEE